MTDTVKTSVDPAGRLDLLLLRLAEAVTRKVEARTGLNIWDGEDGLSGVMATKVKEMGIPSEALDTARPVSIRSLAEQTGFIRRRRQRRLKR